MSTSGSEPGPVRGLRAILQITIYQITMFRKDLPERLLEGDPAVGPRRLTGRVQDLGNDEVEIRK